MVRVADGRRILCDSMVEGFKWKMKGLEFTADLFLMPLRGYDIVLGVQWFSTLGSVTFDFHQHSLEFQVQRRRVLLRGEADKGLKTVGQSKVSKAINQECQSSLIQLYSIQGELMHTRPQAIDNPAVEETPPDLNRILQAYPKVFQTQNPLLPFRPGYDHKIPLMEGTNPNPINLRPYKYPLLQKDVIEKLTQELLDQGVIRPSNSSFASSVVLVKKKDGGWRLSINYRSLNKATIPDRFPIPLVEELLDELQGT